MVAFSETLRHDFKGSGVSVSLVCPFFFSSGLIGSAHGTETLRRAATWLTGKSGYSAEAVAKAVLTAVERNRFYVLPQWEARLLWLVKRASPRLAAHLTDLGCRVALRQSAP